MGRTFFFFYLIFSQMPFANYTTLKKCEVTAAAAAAQRAVKKRQETPTTSSSFSYRRRERTFHPGHISYVSDD